MNNDAQPKGENPVTGNNILNDKSYNFALRIIKLSRYLQEENKEFILSKQVLRSGTAIEPEIIELIKLLTASLKTSKENNA